MAGQLKVGGNIIASHSGVEGAGEVTLQNATLNSGVVFPAGHVIQTITKTDTVTNTEQSGSNVVISSTFFNKNITAKGNNSKFIVNAFVGKTYVQNSNSYGKVSLVRNLNSTETYLNELNSGNQWGGIAVADNANYNPQSYCWVDDSSSCSIGDELQYVINFVRFNTSGDSFFFIDGSNNGSYCSYVIQEIST
jgi:hypothetical protein